MEHYFGNIAIIQNLHFPNLSKTKPQKNISDLSASDVIPNHDDIENLLDDYVFLAMKVAQKYFSFFKFLD